MTLYKKILPLILLSTIINATTLKEVIQSTLHNNDNIKASKLENQAKQKIFNSGMNAFLTKPLKIGELYTVFKLFVTNISERKKVQHSKIVEQTDVLDIQVGMRYSNNNEAFYMEILKTLENTTKP